MTMYNAIFTAGAPIVIGIFDRPVDRAMLLAHPQLYRSGLQGGGLGLGSIAAWMGAACLQGAVVLGLALAGLASVPAAGEAGGGTFGMAQVRRTDGVRACDRPHARVRAVLTCSLACALCGCLWEGGPGEGGWRGLEGV